VVARALNRPGAIHDWKKWEFVVTSELMRAEVYRSLDRLRVGKTLSVEQVADYLQFVANVTAGWEEVPIQHPILRKVASPYPAPLGTLDAIHLATALVWIDEHNEPLTFFTHDRQLAIAARACGLSVKSKSES
jgi:predicted nucleic acid-binding protein